jgi:sugar phosphate isomerase/epimerase
VDPVHIHIPYGKLRDYFDLMKVRRYDLEIYLSAAVLNQLEIEDLEGLRDSLVWNPSLTLHAPFMDLNPGAVDAMVRSATQMRFKQVLTVASVLRPRVIVFHAAYDRWRYAGKKDIWLENSMDTWPRVVEAAARIDGGLRIAVENVFDEDPEALALLIDRVASPSFGFCFDTGHFNLFSTVAMETWFASLGRHLLEVHLHDNLGEEDSHWALGRGNVDFGRFFRLVREHDARPTLTLEAHEPGDIEPSLERIRQLLEVS